MIKLSVGDVVVPNSDQCKDDIRRGHRVFFELFPTPGYGTRGALNFYVGEHAIILELTDGFNSSWSSQYYPKTWYKIITSAGKVGYVPGDVIRPM